MYIPKSKIGKSSEKSQSGNQINCESGEDGKAEKSIGIFSQITKVKSQNHNALYCALCIWKYNILMLL